MLRASKPKKAFTLTVSTHYPETAYLPSSLPNSLLRLQKQLRITRLCLQTERYKYGLRLRVEESSLGSSMPTAVVHWVISRWVNHLWEQSLLHSLFERLPPRRIC